MRRAIQPFRASACYETKAAGRRTSGQARPVPAAALAARHGAAAAQPRQCPCLRVRWTCCCCTGLASTPLTPSRPTRRVPPPSPPPAAAEREREYAHASTRTHMRVRAREYAHPRARAAGHGGCSARGPGARHRHLELQLLLDRRLARGHQRQARRQPVVPRSAPRPLPPAPLPLHRALSLCTHKVVHAHKNKAAPNHFSPRRARARPGRLRAK